MRRCRGDPLSTNGPWGSSLPLDYDQVLIVRLLRFVFQLVFLNRLFVVNVVIIIIVVVVVVVSVVVVFIVVVVIILHVLFAVRTVLAVSFGRRLETDTSAVAGAACGVREDRSARGEGVELLACRPGGAELGPHARGVGFTLGCGELGSDGGHGKRALL
jgi:hypothetical protein